MTPEQLLELRKYYSPDPDPLCWICHGSMKIGEIGSDGIVWHCASIDYLYADEAGKDHFSRSYTRTHPKEDSGVINLLDEYEQLLARDWRKMSMCELMAENQSAMDYAKHWEGRTEKAEKERDELLQALKDVAGFDSLVTDKGLCWCNEDSGDCLSPTCIAARALLDRLKHD
jgi:hypothetical protein